ncbi:MAG: lamin tail domain-containing protein [Candidatus Izemoplasmatales bacterium]
MKFKKFFLLILMVLFAFSFTACQEDFTTVTSSVESSDTTTTTTSGSSIQQQLEQAANMVIISNADSLVAGFTVPAEVGIATVTWSSNNTNVIQVGEYAVDVDGALRFEITVVRPSEADGDTTVVLTGVFTYGTETYSKDYTLRVQATNESSGVTTIAEGIALGVGIYVTYKAMTIVEIVPAYGEDIYSGFFFTDGVDIMYGFDNGYAGSTIMSDIEVGSVYDITGEFVYYYGAPQLANNGDNLLTAVPSSAAAADLPYVTATVSEALDGRVAPSDTAPMEYTLYHLTAKVYVDSSLGNYGVYLVPTDYDTSVTLNLTTTDAIRVYYKSDMEVIAAFQNQVVTIDFILYSYHSSHGDWYGYFYGTANDVDATSLTDAEQLALYVSQVDSTYTVVDAFALPTITKGTYSDVTISSELTSYLTFDGSAFTVVRPEGTDVTGTVSVTIHVGDLSQVVSTSVTVRATGGTVGVDLIISQYVEGSSYNKYIEIYNPTAETKDLSEYVLRLYINGGTLDTSIKNLSLSGTIAPGEVVVISRSDATIYTEIDIFDTTKSVINFNGNDPLVLLHNDVIIDSIGQIGVDVTFGSDVTLIRKGSVTSGDTDPYDAFDPTLEWDSYAKDSATGLGSHTVE